MNADLQRKVARTRYRPVHMWHRWAGLRWRGQSTREPCATPGAAGIGVGGARSEPLAALKHTPQLSLSATHVQLLQAGPAAAHASCCPGRCVRHTPLLCHSSQSPGASLCASSYTSTACRCLPRSASDRPTCVARRRNARRHVERDQARLCVTHMPMLRCFRVWHAQLPPLRAHLLEV